MSMSHQADAIKKTEESHLLSNLEGFVIPEELVQNPNLTFDAQAHGNSLLDYTVDALSGNFLINQKFSKFFLFLF